jgi:hypothetical protein
LKFVATFYWQTGKWCGFLIKAIEVTRQLTEIAAVCELSRPFPVQAAAGEIAAANGRCDRLE